MLGRTAAISQSFLSSSHPLSRGTQGFQACARFTRPFDCNNRHTNAIYAWALSSVPARTWFSRRQRLARRNLFSTVRRTFDRCLHTPRSLPGYASSLLKLKQINGILIGMFGKFMQRHALELSNHSCHLTNVAWLTATLDG